MRDHSLTPSSWHVQVRDRRKQKNITQHELVHLTGIHQSRISQIENGEVDPKLSEIAAISRVLELALVVFPLGFLDAVNFTIRDCEIIEDERNGPPTIPELVLGDRAGA